VPNFFGEQRFGREGRNVARARAMFAGRRVQRHERSLLLSAARSQLFNAVLAQRVERGDWNRAIEGDVWMLDGTQSIFGPEPPSAELDARVAAGDISPTGPLWGSGVPRSAAAAAEIEMAAAANDADLAAGLVQADMRQERRALVLRPDELRFEWLASDELQLEFRLRSGSYATVVIREILTDS